MTPRAATPGRFVAAPDLVASVPRGRLYLRWGASAPDEFRFRCWGLDWCYTSPERLGAVRRGSRSRISGAPGLPGRRDPALTVPAAGLTPPLQTVPSCR